MIKIVDNILSEQECQELIASGSAQLQAAATLGQNIAGYRTADNSWLYEESELTNKIKEYISKDSGLPIENQEEIHIVKYNVGGEYKEHHDFFHPNSDYYETTMGRAGQRTASYLFYLNHNYTGGETDFPKKRIKVTPKMGRMLMWKNMNDDGTLDYDSLHAGLPVKTGVKWIAVVWLRENKFKNK